ncbi:serine/threonine protein kinase [Corallococcus sp. H22C18031201]|nr:serine/threonine protein kinase [Corallococcus sp. H22C18031201]
MHCELCLSEHAEDVVCSHVAWPQVGASAPVSAEAPPASASPATEPTPEPVDLTGRTLGHYRLVRRLGVGGMGAVYLGEQTLIGARVAVKVMHPHLSSDEWLCARFYAEARTVNVVGHPNIVRIFDISEEPGGIHYFVMEYLEGVPLSQCARPMPAAALVPLLAQACDALDAAHRQGVVHRDLKPDNLFVVTQAQAPPALKVLDFGVAKARRASAGDETAAGMVLGTPAYMAPEQWAGQPVDGRADIYALAVTAYYMATGQLPFERGQMAELMLATGPVAPLAPHELAPQVSEGLSHALLRALARRPEDRFDSALDFKHALLAAAQDPASSTHLPEADMRMDTPSLLTPPLTWSARVSRPTGPGAVDVACTALSKGGLFMCCAEPFPLLFTRLEFTLLLEGEEVPCAGEVVRHVDARQARAWGMSSGVGVQFINPSEHLRTLIHRARTPRPGSLMRGRAREARP